MQNEKPVDSGKPLDRVDSALRSVCEKLDEAECDIAEGRVMDAMDALERLRIKYSIGKK